VAARNIRFVVTVKTEKTMMADAKTANITVSKEMFITNILFFIDIQGHIQHASVVNRVLKSIVELDCPGRADFHAQVAIHTRAQIVLVFHELFLFLSACRVFHHFRTDFDGVVRANRLAYTASNTFVVAFLVMGHFEHALKTIEDLQGSPVFGVTFRNLRREKFLSGYAHARRQRFDGGCNLTQICFFLFHLFISSLILEMPTENHAKRHNS
jgi:hypothetical protein